MKTFSNVLLFVIIIVAVFLYLFIPRPTHAPQESTSKTVASCTETDTKTMGSSIFMCVDGEWVYTGSTEINDKG